MTSRLIRIYKNLDIQNIKEHLLICGDLAGQCAKCQELGIKFDVRQCPHCGTNFTYMSFKNIKDHLPKVQRFLSERPDLVLVDYDDFKRLSGALKAEEFLR